MTLAPSAPGSAMEVTTRVFGGRTYGDLNGVRIVLAFFNTLTILALASRAFAFYYALQCFVAINVSKKPLEKLAMRLLAAVLIFIAVFSVPAG